jgi:hypothetical protein
MKMDICFDHKAPSIVISINEYMNGYREIRRRGRKIRLITEITSENINYCKELMNMVDEFRHLDGIKGGLAVSEREFMATTVLRGADSVKGFRSLLALTLAQMELKNQRLPLPVIDRQNFMLNVSAIYR